MVSADLIVHVRDISHPESEAQREDVEQVLAEIGIAEEGEGPPMIEAWNKIDLLEADERERVAAEAARKPETVPISALKGEGIGDLLAAIAARLRAGSRLRRVTLPSADGAAIAWLHKHGQIVQQHANDLETELEVRISDADWARFQMHRR